MPDALARVKNELGRDAVILHTRSIKRGGLLGLGGRWLVEITATADPRVTAVRQQSREAQSRLGTPGKPAREGILAPAQASAGAGAGILAPSALSSATASNGSRSGAAGPGREFLPPEALNEIRQIRAMVQDLLRRPDSRLPADVPAELLDYYTGLVGQQVAGELVREILERARLGAALAGDSKGQPPGREQADSRERIEAEMIRCVSEMLPPGEPLELSAMGRPTVVALVGPTGVGKTTTLAKLAANMKLREGRRVGLITIDTYRIAAVEQLRTYANILQVPLTAVASPQEIQEAVRGMRDQDLILIDTAGRSQRDELRIAELNAFLTAARPDQVHLVLSGTSQEGAIREAIERFSAVGARHVIFTKLDEAVGFGVILNVLRGLDLRLSYLTHGQAVPDDIMAGSAQHVARLVLGLSETPDRSIGRSRGAIRATEGTNPAADFRVSDRASGQEEIEA